MTTKLDAVKKRRPNRRPLRWKLLWGSSEILERSLDGAHCARIAVIPRAALDQTLVFVIVRIIVTDVSRPVLEEAKGQASIPIRVVVGNVLIRLEANGAADAGREEAPPLVLEGIGDRSLDRIRVAEHLEIIRRPPVADGKGPLAGGPRRTALHLQIVDVWIRGLARIVVIIGGEGEGDLAPFRRNAATVVDLDSLAVFGIGSPNVSKKHAVSQIEFGLHCRILTRVGNAAEHIVRRHRRRSRERQLGRG